MEDSLTESTGPGDPAERLLWPGRASPSAPQLVAFSPGKEQAAGVWETCLAPGWQKETEVAEDEMVR